MTALVGLVLGVFLGMAVGALYVRLLWANVALYVGGGSRVRALALHVARLGLAASAMWVSARWSALVLVGALAGFLAARFWGVRARLADRERDA